MCGTCHCEERSLITCCGEQFYAMFGALMVILGGKESVESWLHKKIKVKEGLKNSALTISSVNLDLNQKSEISAKKCKKVP